MAGNPLRRVPLGRVRGHRGKSGEVTVRVYVGGAALWPELRRVWLGDEKEDAVPRQVESSRGYRDRLVLKLAGVDDPSAAEALRGLQVWAEAAAAAPKDEGEPRAALLIGLDVVDADGRRLGHVSGVMPTAGTDLLVVQRSRSDGDAGGELLVPCAREIVVAVDEDRGLVRVRLPHGLLELNRPAARERDS